ncbi:MAG: NAD(P)/FAD-dependent oxidoreductase [Thermomonas sp.]
MTAHDGAVAMHDVVILGGGLAGLSLALQLKRQDPAIDVCVIERHQHPVREAAFKIGESTVEIGAWYFAEVLGLREHMEQEQIKKFGFRFFFSDGRTDIDHCPELGTSGFLPFPAWQLDRGRFENMLAQRVRDAGVHLHAGARVRSFDLVDGEPGDADSSSAPRLHNVQYHDEAGEHVASARWLIDASGRAGLVKRKLGLARSNDHNINAVWFRVPGRIDPHDWSDDPAWLGRCDPPERWRSTNHLCGPGYWVWLIPLASGAHSVGIVCDAEAHPLDGMNNFEKAMEWLARHQPRLAQALVGAEPMDFAFFRDVSYNSAQVFSPNRWALTGEAGVFLDPFYSPGSDFIAISNTYIADLIAKDRAGEPIAAHAGVYEQLYFSFYESTLAMYQGQYGLFANARLMSLKVVWDYTYYWGVLAPLYCGGRIADLTVMARIKVELARAKALNFAMQAFLRAWHEASGAQPEDTPRLLDQSALPWFAKLNRELAEQSDTPAFLKRIRGNIARLEVLAREMHEQAHRQVDLPEGMALDGLLAEATQAPAECERLLGDAWYVGTAVC